MILTNTRRTPSQGWLAWLPLCVLFLPGCGDGPLHSTGLEDPAVREELEDGLSALDILTRMSETYREADSYIDNAQYHERYVRLDDGLEYDVPPHLVSVMFSRPGRVRVNRQVPELDGPGLVVAVTSNGQLLRAFVSDIPEQVLELPAPLPPTIATLFSDPLLRAAILPVPVTNLYPQLDLLLADDEHLAGLLELGTLKRLASEPIDGKSCFRIRLNEPEEGPRVMWISKDTFLLRRMEMPTNRVRQAMDPQGVLKSLDLWIDFDDAATGVATDDSTFEMEVPPGALRVTKLVDPPRPISDWVGKSTTGLAFADLTGEPVTSEAFAGKAAILDFWYTGCEPCRRTAPALEELYQHYRDNDGLAMYAVSVDAPHVSNETIEKTLRAWGPTMPILRDTEDVGSKELGVKGWPTTLLLGPDGRIHHFAAGAENSYTEWYPIVDALLSGEDVAGRLLADQQRKQANYRAAVDAVSLDGPLPWTEEPVEEEPAADAGLQLNLQAPAAELPDAESLAAEPSDPEPPAAEPPPAETTIESSTAAPPADATDTQPPPTPPANEIEEEQP